MMDISIDAFQTSFFITSIKKLTFQLPHIRIIGTSHCGNTHREAFKILCAKKYVLCRRDYIEIVVSILTPNVVLILRSKYNCVY